VKNTRRTIVADATTGTQSSATILNKNVGLTDVERVDQSWQLKCCNDGLPPKKPFFGDFVKMKGGEFFSAPSIPFLQSL